MSMDFCALALNAATSPYRDFSSKSMPHELGRHQLLCGSRSRVRQRVDGVEYSLSPAFRHYRSCYSCRYITQKSESSVFEGDVLYAEVSNGGAVVLDIRVTLLIGSHGPVVQPRLDGIYGSWNTRHLAACWLKLCRPRLLITCYLQLWLKDGKIRHLAVCRLKDGRIRHLSICWLKDGKIRHLSICRLKDGKIRYLAG